MNTMNPAAAMAVLESLKKSGQFFSVTFIKKSDGKARTFSGVRYNVQKHLKGGKSTTAHKKELSTVWSETEGYKCFSIENVLEIRAMGTVLSTK